MRLLYFDLTQGNWIGAKYLIEKLGWRNGINIVSKLKWVEAFDNPFIDINKALKPTEKQRLSQRQMTPLVILYQLLQEEGYSSEEALKFCSDLSQEVAVAFLNFSIPKLKKSELANANPSQLMQIMDKISGRFFNAETTNQILDNDELFIEIHTCHFASYAKELGVPELGPIFCAADSYYFENFQKEVDFNRTQTLAINQKPCDFRFKWTTE